MKKFYFRSEYGCFYEISIKVLKPSYDFWQTSIEEFSVTDDGDERKIIFRIVKVKKDGYYILPRISHDTYKPNFLPISFAIDWKDAVAVIVNAMSYYFVSSPSLDEKYVQRIRNLRELPNYYMATALLRFDFEFENEKKDLD